MTAFVCLLSPDAGASFAERVMSGLDAAFPQHQFITAEAEAAGYENTIIAFTAMLAAETSRAQ